MRGFTVVKLAILTNINRDCNYPGLLEEGKRKRLRGRCGQTRNGGE